ncbi:MAG: hypothetical protein O2913_05395 [Chloroflexi bacterium]|nr:hypothetical protein [Chloroflexota bacterium]
MTTARTGNRNVTVRQRPYKLLVTEAAGPTDTDRATVLTPRSGYRVRLVRLRILQTAGEGRFLVETYFGTAPNLIADPSQGIDILAVPNIGSDSTRTFARREGPFGRRDEPVSVRHRGVAPTTSLRIFIDYTEEP